MEQERKQARRARRQLAQFMVCGTAFVLVVAVKLLTPEHALTLRRTLSGALEHNIDVQAVFSAVGQTFAGEQDAGDGLRKVWQAVFLPAQTENAVQSENSASVDAIRTENAVNADAARESVDAVQTESSANVDAVQPEPSENADNVQIEPSANADGASQTLTPHAWQDNFGNSTAFASLSEAWPDTSETASGVADISAEPASDGNAVEDNGQAFVYSGKNLPENVGMEQVILNFDYQCPVEGTLTSGFGYRQHPVDGAERFHYGVDIAAETGTAILCFADGTVTATGESSSFGKYCTVEHAGGFTTLYAHCSRVTATSGTAVRMGEKIAEVGATGNATGAHLHFALQREGVYLNPIYYVAG